MDMVGRAFAGLVPRHDDRGDAAGGLGGEEHSHVEAERLDRQRLFGRNDSGLQWGSRVHGYVSSPSRRFSSTSLASPEPQLLLVSCAAADSTERRSVRGNIATLAQKIAIFIAASYL